ncbi:hypothetical protein QR680_017716 [Steinernema hermaphroditum]|uniref:Uncharacterized protein n=1 Tax=Steinernema hermaphroditum TaxID=289476 RepID=A0AA39HFK2_9BILA|nr:hypothetical protein QR680_017716 [Steinernema hermaphroditum]
MFRNDDTSDHIRRPIRGSIASSGYTVGEILRKEAKVTVGFQNFWVDDEAIYGGFENDAEPVAICRVVDYRLSTGKISTAYFPREASSCTLSELYGDFSDLEEDDPPEESPPFRSLQNYGRKQTVAIDVDSRQITV